MINSDPLKCLLACYQYGEITRPAYSTIIHRIDQDREEAIAVIHRQ